MPPGERPMVGLALSAGGVRGLAHIGVLQVLEDAGFPIDVVAGTSMGAMVGGLYASGIPMSRLRTLPNVLNLGTATNLSKFRLIQLMLTDRLLSTQKTEDFIRETIGNRRFDQIPKPFGCVAMDLKTGEPIIFREGLLAPAIRSSLNLPGLFSPVEYRHRYLVDGGVVDYIPIDAVKLLGADWVLASVTQGDYTRTTPTNVLMTLQQVIDIRGALLAREQKRHANALVEPAVGDIPFYESPHGPEALRRGLAAMRTRLAETQENFILFSIPRLWRRWKDARNGRTSLSPRPPQASPHPEGTPSLSEIR